MAAILRPGTAPATVGVPGLLRRLLPKLWQSFPRAAVRVRLDGGFASPAIFDLLEDAGVEYVVAMATNAVLLTEAAPSLAQARTVADASAQSARVFADTSYQAKTWRQARRVIIKAEVVAHPGRELRDNPRFLVTNLRHTPETVYDHIYAARGDSENRIRSLTTIILLSLRQTAIPRRLGVVAHWFLTSESASRTLMNACLVTPSRRAS